MNILDATEAEKLITNAKVLFEVNEFSELQSCSINAVYYQLDDYHFIEHVTRNYVDTGKSADGYFMYDSPASILFVLIHSEDNNIKHMAEEFIRQYIKSNNPIMLYLPDTLKSKVRALAQKYDCSVETMLTNLISQGVDSETEVSSFYANQDRRTPIVNGRLPITDASVIRLKTDSTIVFSK